MTANAIDKEQWALLSPLLDELLDMTEPGRSQRLAALRAEHGDVVDRLEAMLLQDKALQVQGFLETPAAQAVIETLTRPEAAPDLAGQPIGPYVLQRELGQGGMGSVWLARRADGRFEGDVAIKFLKSGLFGSGSARRFAREGQILGRLSHPHIARLLDAGVHEGTQPYLVLEYVEGQPIDQYCQQHGLDAAARIRLFLDVLAAVAHAHSRLILHRDLKPSNILVTPGGEVKLLDFGIAKLLDDAAQAQEGAAATEITQRAGNAYTPLFAAPEQVQLADVTTATDVYALGVLLYLLLGGRHPTVGATQSQLDHLKAVVEIEPKRLSTVAAESADPALARQARQLKGDLDTILAKALKKKPAERYANAQALADDLNHWLAHEPITARPDSRLYVLGRFVRRHRLAVAFGGLAVLGLAGLTAVSVWQARRAEAAQLQAQARRQQAEDVLSFMLGEFADKLRPIGRLELLDSVGGKALKVLDESGPLTAVDRLQRAKALTVIGEVRVSKRDFEGAQGPLQAATELLQSDPPAADMTAAWRKAQGAAAFWQGEVAFRQRQLAAAETHWGRYRQVSEQWLQTQPQDADAQLELSYAENSLGSLQLRLGRLAQAEQAFMRSKVLKDALLVQRPNDLVLQRDWSDTASWLGTALMWQGRARSAASEFESALARVQAVRQSRPEDLAWLASETGVRAKLGRARMTLGEADTALWSQASTAASRLVASDPSNVQWAFVAIEIEADRLAQQADSPERVRQARELLTRLEGLRAGKPPLEAWLPRSVKLLALMAPASCPAASCAAAAQAADRIEQRLNTALRRSEDLDMLNAAVHLQLIKAGQLAADKAAGRAACMQALSLLRTRNAWSQVHAELTQRWLQAEQCLDPSANQRPEWRTAQAWLSSQRDR